MSTVNYVEKLRRRIHEALKVAGQNARTVQLKNKANFDTINGAMFRVR